MSRRVMIARRVGTVIRYGLAGFVAGRVYRETGVWTTVAVGLLFLNTEASGWITRNIYERLDDLDDSVRLLLGVRRKTAAGESAAETTKGNP